MKGKIRSSAGMGLAIAGLAFGILAILLVFLDDTSLPMLILGILGITFGAVALSLALQANARIGIIIVALAISVLGAALAVARITKWYPWQKDSGKADTVQKKEIRAKSTQPDKNQGIGAGSDSARYEDILEELENETE